MESLSLYFGATFCEAFLHISSEETAQFLDQAITQSDILFTRDQMMCMKEAVIN